MDELRVPVLIVGGGGCGLSMSIFLANLGVEALTIERHPGSAVVPKARYINQRTMEIFRQHGLAEAVYSRSMPLKHISRIRWCTTLGGDGPLDRREFYKIDSFGGGALTHYAKDSPCSSTLYPQVRMEPLLRAESEKRAPGRLLYNHELIEVEQDADGVTATVLDRGSQRTIKVRADYLIAADGGKTLGPKLGVKVEGPTDLVEMVTIYFKADLSAYWDDDYAMTTWFVNPDGGSWASGVLGQLGPKRFGRHSEEWMFHFSFRPDDPARHNEEALLPRMRELLKIPDFDPEIIRVGRWVVEGVLADRFRFGRIFLAGDAAHRHPPTTGLGLNSAVQDAHNLAWKLALVLKDAASDALLESFETERRPVAARNVSWALMTFNNHALTDGAIGLVRGNPEVSKANFEALFAETDEGRTRRARLDEVMQIQRMEWQAHDLEIGFNYEQGAVVADGTLAPRRDPMGGVYTPTTRPGHRLPHAWVSHEGAKVSTHDLVDPGGFLLITGRKADGWRQAAAELAPRLGVRLDVVTVDEDDAADEDRGWMRHRGISAEGAILVRPDNHTGWRSIGASADGLAELRDAFAKLLGLPLAALASASEALVTEQ